MLGVIRPTSLESAFTIDAPGEYEVHEVLVTGVRTFRDDAKGSGARPEHLVRVRARRPPRDPPRRRRSRPDRADAGRDRLGPGRLRARRRRPVARPRRGAGRWSGRRTSSSRCRSATTSSGPHALERFLKEMSVTDPPAGRQARGDHLDRPAGDHGGRPGATRPHLTRRCPGVAGWRATSPCARRAVQSKLQRHVARRRHGCRAIERPRRPAPGDRLRRSTPM